MWTQNHNRAKNRENIPCYVFPPITPARTPQKGRRKKKKSFGSKSSEEGLERAETRAEGGGVWVIITVCGNRLGELNEVETGSETECSETELVEDEVETGCWREWFKEFGS